MSDERTIDELIAASSLGDPEALAVRAEADPEIIERVLARADEIDAKRTITILDHTGAPLNGIHDAECDHGVTFDEQEWRRNPKTDVHKRWPRLMGNCPKGCGYNGIAYASFIHYIAGDW